MRPGDEPPADPAFAYPEAAHVRRHGPMGYADDGRYKPWPRDEFDYRCVYCLCREAWFPDGDASLSVEHSVAVSAAPPGPTSYDTLLYACCLCNAIRQATPLPLDPCCGLGAHLVVRQDGTIRGLSGPGEDLIEACRLDRPALVEYRRTILAVLAFFRASGEPAALEVLGRYLAYPASLPDLSVLVPPGNTRPEGVLRSASARRRRGELPAMY